ncbi:MAG: metal ABC transporter permease, partial [Chloroflexota bacterium]
AYLITRPGLGMVLAAAIGVVETWLGIDLAYVSYYWLPGGKGWPVSFFITSLALLFYVAARLSHPAFRRRVPPAVLRPREV